MTYRKIDYLEWARTFMGNVRFDLARSNVKSLTREELGLPDALDLNIADEQGHPELRKAIAARVQADPARVLVTNGATAAIALACSAVIQTGDEVLLESPNYEPLYRNPVHLGATVKMLERTFENGWQIDLEELERKISRRTRILILTNSHNPSGVATNPDKMLTIGQIARDHGARVLVCETFLDNLFKAKPVPCATQGDNFISIGSMSKIYGLGAIRIGWLVAAEQTVTRAKAAADYLAGGISAPSQAVALHALREADRLVERCRKIVLANLRIVGDWVRKRSDMNWVEPDAGTIALLKLPPHMDAMALSILLREKYSTLVAPGDFFWLKGFIRVSLGIDEDILRAGLKNLSSAIDELKSSKR